MDVKSLFKGHTVKSPVPSVWARITPSLAKRILEDDSINMKNRRVSPIGRKRLTESMSKDEFMVTHQGLAFDREGKLRDGQHRLWAILDSGKSQLLMVTFDLEPKAMQVIDIGRRRTIKDVLFVGAQIVATSRLPGLLSVVAQGRMGCVGQLRPEDAVDAYQYHQPVIEETMELFRNTSKRAGSACIAGVIARALYSHSAHRLRPFVDTLRIGVSDVDTRWAQHLITRINDLTSISSSGTRMEVYGKTQYALRQYLNGVPFPPSPRLYDEEEELFPVPSYKDENDQ